MFLWIALGFLALWIVGVMILHLGSFINLAVLIAVGFLLAHLFRLRSR